MSVFHRSIVATPSPMILCLTFGQYQLPKTEHGKWAFLVYRRWWRIEYIADSKKVHSPLERGERKVRLPNNVLSFSNLYLQLTSPLGVTPSEFWKAVWFWEN